MNLLQIKSLAKYFFSYKINFNIENKYTIQVSFYNKLKI